MKAIHTLIGMDLLTYQNLKDGSFERWCKYMAGRYRVPFRAFTMDIQVTSWYMHNFKIRVEDTFYMDNIDYINNNVDAVLHYKDLFVHIANEESNLMNVYPKVLLDKAKTKYYATSRFTYLQQKYRYAKYLQN